MLQKVSSSSELSAHQKNVTHFLQSKKQHNWFQHYKKCFLM